MEETTEKAALQVIAQQKAGYEIALGQLQQQLEQNGNYYKLKYADTIPGISTLQAHLGPNQALISFGLTTDCLLYTSLPRS